MYILKIIYYYLFIRQMWFFVHLFALNFPLTFYRKTTDQKLSRCYQAGPGNGQILTKENLTFQTINTVAHQIRNDKVFFVYCSLKSTVD